MSQYEQLGVSSQKGEVHNATKNLDKGLFPNAFCNIYPDILTGDEAFCLIAHADGVGTKTSLGYVYGKETGDMSVFRNLAIDAIVMNLDDMLCVGATGPFTLTQSIDRNKHKVSGEVLAHIVEGTRAFIDKMKVYGIDIIYCGGETADVGDLVRTITLNASMQARMKRSNVIEANIRPGNVIVGLSSYGQATYEDEYNSGMGSNGLTLGRHGVFSEKYRKEYPESYDPILDEKGNAYTGSLNIDSCIHVSGHAIPIGELILSPTRTYAPIIKEVLATVPGESIAAMIHCSGGGQTKCLKFANGVHIVKNRMIDPPPVFETIQRETKEEWKNMYETFNMGLRYELYCDEKVADTIIRISERFNVQAVLMGYVEKSEESKLTLFAAGGPHVYKK